MPEIDKPKLKVSRRGLELIKSFEGFRPRAERLADGRWVVGHGHTLSAREGATVTATEAELLLQYDLLPVLNAISDRVDLPLNQHQVDALASFGLNMGVERFLASEVLVWVNAGEPEDAARALIASDAPAATPAPDMAARRRAAESALFRHDPEVEADLAALLSAPVAAAPVEAVEDAAVEAPAPAADEGGDARAMAVAHLLGETEADQPQVEAEAEPVEPEVEIAEAAAGPEAVEAVEDAPVVTPVFAAPVEAEEAAPEPVAANENGDEDAAVEDAAEPEQEEAQPTEEPVAPAPAAPSTAMVLSLQRYTPYAVQGGAAFAAVDAGASGAAPGDGVLVLTSPPEVEPEPPTREVWPESARPGAVVDEEPLFIEDPAVRAGGQPVFMPESFEPERRGRLDWSETGAFMGMGAVGLTAFGAAIFGFRMAAERPVHYGLDQTTIASWVLALIGALCVGISAYNLYLRWSRRDAE